MNLLDIDHKVVYDHSISNEEEHTYMPYSGTSFDHGSEIRIPIQQQDKYLNISNSHLHVIGKILKPDGTAIATDAHMVNNGVLHLFQEARYELGAHECDRAKNVGMSSTMKGYVSYGKKDLPRLHNAGWTSVNSTVDPPLVHEKQFHAIIPLSMFLGLPEDYKTVFMSIKHELVLIRSRNDVMALMTTNNDHEGAFVKISKVCWRVKHVTPSDEERLRMLQLLKKNAHISVSFRLRDMYEFPILPLTTRHIWNLKTASEMEKPRYIILGFQTDRKKHNANGSQFDTVDLTNVKLYLNSHVTPYDQLNVNFATGDYGELYKMMLDFPSSYYSLDEQQALEPMVNRAEYKNYAPLIVLDCSRQPDSVKATQPIDIRLEFETLTNIASNTALYCLIIHDRVITYRPLTGEVLIQQ